MHVALLLAACLQASPTDAELVRAWSGLNESDRSDTIEWFIAECDNAKHFRATLERYVIVAAEGDHFDWPGAEEPPRYDTNVHTPAQLIPRRFVEDVGGRVRPEVKKLLGNSKVREAEIAYRYDWGRGTIVKVQAWDDPLRIAKSAAAGFSPYTDLVEALVEQTLDRGEVRDAAKAFSHAYSDRSGNAYRSVTLYDAWSSGRTLEMPDVECLGILHDLENDWRSYVAPVPGNQQRPLYDRIGKQFAPLRRYRALRTALARVYVQGECNLPSGYESAAQRLHGLWELNQSDPMVLAKDLPTDEAWGEWWSTRGAEADGSKEVFERAKARKAALEESRAWTRRTFHGILKEYGAFDPKPPVEEPAETPVDPPKEGDSTGGDGGQSSLSAEAASSAVAKAA